MIIDTLVVVVCLITDTPRIQRVERVPVRVEVQHQPNRFSEQFQQADSLFNVASEEAMRSAIRETRFERYRALGIISPDEYHFLKQSERELNEMKTLRRKGGKS